jgi:AcrR family transcriptional regulator
VTLPSTTSSVAVTCNESSDKGIGVADLMKEAGLTVGGFYKHFESRDHLVAEALDAMKSAWDPVFEDAEVRGCSKGALFDSLVDGYLDRAHRDAPADGCLPLRRGRQRSRTEWGEGSPRRDPPAAPGERRARRFDNERRGPTPAATPTCNSEMLRVSRKRCASRPTRRSAAGAGGTSRHKLAIP